MRGGSRDRGQPKEGLGLEGVVLHSSGGEESVETSGHLAGGLPTTNVPSKRFASVRIIYALEDKLVAERLHAALNAGGGRVVSVWQDWGGGEQELFDIVEQHDVCVFISTTVSVSCASCDLELRHALKCGKRILPIEFGAEAGRHVVANDVLLPCTVMFPLMI
jgi:hypothetical protein